jgi:hypothetical protein
VAYTPTSATANQKVAIVATTSASLAGRTVYIVRTGTSPRVLGTGAGINASGVARTYAQLLRTGTLQLVVPKSPLAAGPYDPNTPLLARSGLFTVTIG